MRCTLRCSAFEFLKISNSKAFADHSFRATIKLHSLGVASRKSELLKTYGGDKSDF
jgi:hypothetical protein